MDNNSSRSVPVSPVSMLHLSPSSPSITIDHAIIPPVLSTTLLSLYPSEKDDEDQPQLSSSSSSPAHHNLLTILRNTSGIRNLLDDNPYDHSDDDEDTYLFPGIAISTTTNSINNGTNNDEEEHVHQQYRRLAMNLLLQFQKTKQYRQVLTALYKFADSQVRNIFTSGRYNPSIPKNIPFHLRYVPLPESYMYHKDLAKELHSWLDNAVNVCIQQFWPYRENRHVSLTLKAHNSFLLRKSSSFFQLSSSSVPSSPHGKTATNVTLPPVVTEFHPTFIGFPQHLLYQRLNDLYKVSLMLAADTTKKLLKSPSRTNTVPHGDESNASIVATPTNAATTTDGPFAVDGDAVPSTTSPSSAVDSSYLYSPSEAEDNGTNHNELSSSTLPIEVVDNVRNHFENILLDELYDITFHVCDEDVQEELKTARQIYERAQYYFTRPDELDIPLAVRDARVLQLAAVELGKMNHYSSPELKMLCIANAFDILVRALKLGPRPFDKVPVYTYDKPLYKTQATGADDLLPAILWLILYCFNQTYVPFTTVEEEGKPVSLPSMNRQPLPSPWSRYRWSAVTGAPFRTLGHALLLTSNSLYIQRFRDSAQMVGKTGYCYVHLQSCLHYILSLTIPGENDEPEASSTAVTDAPTPANDE